MNLIVPLSVSITAVQFLFCAITSPLRLNVIRETRPEISHRSASNYDGRGPICKLPDRSIKAAAGARHQKNSGAFMAPETGRMTRAMEQTDAARGLRNKGDILVYGLMLARRRKVLLSAEWR